ncbi:MAG: hypothetical protein R3B13_09135 [Polyangiaceae bacterium]
MHKSGALAAWFSGLVLFASSLSITGCGSEDSSGGTPASGGSGAASGGSNSGGANTGGANTGGASAGSGGTGAGGNAGSGGSACVRTPAPADAERVVVISHSYDANSKPAGSYETLTLQSDGTLAKTGTTFAMGRSVTGEIVFTPDGKLGFVATDDGNVGVFRVDSPTQVTVLHQGFAGNYYATKLAMSPDGSRLFVIDGEWRNIGGGIYAIDIDCNDDLTNAGLVAAGKLPQGLVFLSGNRAVVPAHDLLASPLDQHVHLLDWSASPSVLASAIAFGQDTPIVSNAAVTQDEKYVLIGDNSGFSTVPNRVAVVELNGNSLKPLQELSPLEDPADLETSPFDDTALVSSGIGDALVVLSHNASAPTAPFTHAELTYSGDPPQLPVDMVQIRRGALEGVVLVAEVTGIRKVRFQNGAPPIDQGRFDLGAGTENIIGAIGVTP